MNFRRFMGLNAEMFPIQDNKILFWIDDIAILDTSTMSWELVQTKGQYQPEDGFAHVVGSTLYSFFASERSFRQLRIGEWEWQDWEVNITRLCARAHFFSTGRRASITRDSFKHR